MMNIKIVLYLTILFLLSSCQKDPGFGGTSTISGKVFVKEYNYNFTQLLGEYYAQKEDVYIIFGNDTVYSENFETNYDGTYIFKYLRKGNYTIYVYSDDTTSLYPEGKAVFMKEVEISENGQNLILDDFVIYKN